MNIYLRKSNDVWCHLRNCKSVDQLFIDYKCHFFCTTQTTRNKTNKQCCNENVFIATLLVGFIASTLCVLWIFFVAYCENVFFFDSIGVFFARLVFL